MKNTKRKAIRRYTIIQRLKKPRGAMRNNKKIVLYALVAWIIIVVGGIAIWFTSLEKWEQPLKPEKVPQDAIWAGGYDGGNFFLLQSVYSDTCHFTIYGEYDGNIWYDGYFYCDKNDFRQIAEMNWHELITGYNGIYIFMKDPNNCKTEIVWRKVMPSNVPNDAYWVEGDKGGWFFLLQSVYSDTCHFIIYDGITGDTLRDGLFYCSKNDFEHIKEEKWSNLLSTYKDNEIFMTDPVDKNEYVKWCFIE